MAGEAKNSGETLSLGGKIKGFVEGVKSEFSKIIFPNQEDLKKETIATIVVSVLIGLLIFVLDTALKALLGFIL
ncbi:MAG: preprotein translocase subunit SecE [Lachnospiraceae bacterium]|nr:preprotein translocase subunit SecE [Lachnospiraceae bacterium]